MPLAFAKNNVRLMSLQLSIMPTWYLYGPSSCPVLETIMINDEPSRLLFIGGTCGSKFVLSTHEVSEVPHKLVDDL